MKIIPLVSIAVLSLSLYGAMGSSVKIPEREHMKYTFGNHKNHPVQKQEEARYLKSLAPLDKEAVQKHLTQQGYTVTQVKLRDIASELVYEVYATDTTKKSLKLYADPKNGSVLKTEDRQ